MAQKNQQPAPIDTLFQTYDRNFYKITGQEETDSILDMIDTNDPNANNSTSVVIDPSSIGSGPITATLQTAVGSLQQGKSLFTSTVEGYILGVDPVDGLAKFAIGNSVSFFQWDGTNITTTGVFTATGFSLIDSNGNMVVSGNASGASTKFAMVITPTSAVPSGLYISSAANGYGILIAQGDLTTNFSPLQIGNSGLGSNLFINSNSSAGSTLVLQNNTPGTAVLSLSQFGVTSTHFTAMIELTATGNIIWLSDGTTPNGNLAGTRGDFCFNGTGGHAFWCSATGTSWTQI